MAVYGPNDDIPLKVGEDPFVSALNADDQVLMYRYERDIKAKTLDLTGREVNERLVRINKEFRRIEDLRNAMTRLKRITKAALLSLGAEEAS